MIAIALILQSNFATVLSPEYYDAWQESTDGKNGITLWVNGNLPESLEDLEFPDEVEDGGKMYPVLSISRTGCFNNQNVKTVKLPTSLISLGDNAFYNCSNLRTVTVPDTLIDFGSDAFFRCSNLVSIKIPSGVTRLKGASFRDCIKLESITLPSGITQIDSLAFYGSGITSIYLPDSITTISGNTFNGAENLTTVEMSDNVTTIGASAFYGCAKLTNLKLSKGLEVISDSAFGDCASLQDLELPDSLTSIGQYAFYNCSSLKSVIIPAGVTQVGDGAFWADSHKDVVPAIWVKGFAEAPSINYTRSGSNTVVRYAGEHLAASLVWDGTNWRNGTPVDATVTLRKLSSAPISNLRVCFADRGESYCLWDRDASSSEIAKIPDTTTLPGDDRIVRYMNLDASRLSVDSDTVYVNALTVKLSSDALTYGTFKNEIVYLTWESNGTTYYLPMIGNPDLAVNPAFTTTKVPPTDDAMAGAIVARMPLGYEPPGVLSIRITDFRVEVLADGKTRLTFGCVKERTIDDVTKPEEGDVGTLEVLASEFPNKDFSVQGRISITEAVSTGSLEMTAGAPYRFFKLRLVER